MDAAEDDEELFLIMLRFMYTRRLECKFSKLLPLLQMANKYDVKRLRQEIANYLYRSLEKFDNCFEVLLVASRIEECKILVQKCLDNVITCKMEEALQLNYIEYLDFDVFVSLMKRDDLLIKNESSALKGMK